MITVQDIIDIPGLNLKLLTGAKAAGDPVRWVHIAEVRDPVEWLKGGELLLTTGMGEYTQSGVIGRPSLASAEKSKAVLASLVESFACVLAILRRA